MSTIKSNRHQIGVSGTATQNFTLTAEAADGSMKLARGNAGATTQDLISVDGNGVISIGKLDNYANDSAAATGGVPVGGLYHTSGTLKIRLT